MYRTLVILSFATAGIAAPLAAQGHSGRQTRTYIDARGRQCRETTHLKRNGDEKYELKCREAKGRKGWKHEDEDDDRDDDRYDDGRYDDGRHGTGTSCFDTRGRRCDVVQGRSYPATLPEMASAVIWGRGQRTTTASRWLGGNSYRVRYVDRDRDGRPETASWFGSDGRMIQQWVDRDHDGRADAVKIYRDGRLVRLLGS
jgi:hypothetical protein